MPNKHIIFLVHGMGDFKPGWSVSAQQTIRDQYTTYKQLKFIPFDQRFDFVELNYNDEFEALREMWRKMNKDLGAALATGTTGEVGQTTDDKKGITRLNEVASVTNKGSLLNTHVVDALLYFAARQTAATVRESIREQLFAALKKQIDAGQTLRWSVIAHSLGTAVMHDSLHEAYSDVPTKYGGNLAGVTRPTLLAMIANVSRFLQTDSDVYLSRIRPGNPDDPDAACKYYLNAHHQWDPIPQPRAFRPATQWPSPGVRARNLYVDVETSEIEQLNVHDFNHYLRNPLVHVPIFNCMLDSEVIDAHTLDVAHGQFAAHTQFAQYVSNLKRFQLGEKAEWRVTVNGWSGFLSDTATSFIDVDRGIEDLELDSVKSGHNGGPSEPPPAASVPKPVPRSPAPAASGASLESASPPPRFAGAAEEPSEWKGPPPFAAAVGPADQFDILENTGEAWQAAKPVEEVAPPPNPPRYTDIAVLDPDQRVHGALEPLLALTTYTLEVAIRGERRGLTKDRGDQQSIDLLMPPQVKTVSVWAAISDETEGESEIAQQLFSFDRKFAEFKLPPTGDSYDSAVFRFTTLPGRIALNRPHPEVCPRIGIRLYHKLNLIDHLRLDLRIEPAVGGAASTTEDPAIRVVFQHPSGEAATIEPPNPSSAPRALTISISKADTPANSYRFAIAAGSRERPEEPALSGTKKLSEDELNDFVARFRELLLPTIFGAALGQVSLPDKDRDELLKNLSLLGSEIVTRLFDFSPGGDFFELGAIVRDALPDMSIIQISLSEDAKDFVFPWQTLTVQPSGDADTAADPNNLWGYRFIIEVKRRGDGVDLRRRAPQPPAPALMSYARWHFKNEPAHYAALEALAQKATVPVQWIAPVIESQADFINALARGGGDLVYVYAHGHAAAPNTPLGTRYRDNAQQQIKAVAQRMKSNPLQQSMTQNEGWTDLEEQFLKLTRAGAESSLTLSKSDVGLTSLLVAIGGSRQRLTDAPIVFLNTCESAQIWNAVDGSFVGFFLDRGARAVVGTESTIPIVLADAFGRETLKHLFAGDSLGEAVFKARLVLLHSSKNPLGLCYCLYGAADTRLGPDPLVA